MLEERIEPTDHDSKRYNESAGNVSKRDVEAETIDRSHPVIFKETRICPPKSEVTDDASEVLEAVSELPKTLEATRGRLVLGKFEKLPVRQEERQES